MDASRVVGLWRSFFPTRYWVDEELVFFNTVESGLFLPEASVVRDDGFVLVKSSAVGRLYGEVPSTCAHVSSLAFASPDVGLEMLASVRKSLESLGYESWQFGGDWRHFFPGCPSECAELRAVLMECGMAAQGAPVFDLERDLRDYLPPVSPTDGARGCPVHARDALDEFLAREFPGRWRTDVMEKFEENPARVIALWLKFELEGFAMIQMEDDAHRRAGAVWSHDLGPGWAALGPIGVSKAVRGQGHGHALLAAALCALRDQGARRTIIDWTTLTGFYGLHGFEVAREYATYAGPFSE